VSEPGDPGGPLARTHGLVLANRLWPRSLTGDDRHTDRRTLRQHAKVEERAPDEQVDAQFDHDPTHQQETT
jgi:uncharacterized protein YeaO (DUF488 family)